MTRLHALHSGRLRVWWWTHRREAKNAACLVAIVSAFLVVSHFDYQDQINAERAASQFERAARESAVEQLRQERAVRGLPRTTFVIEASTLAEADRKLAEIAGDLDVERLKNRGVK